MSAEDVHHRLVIAIETSSTASSVFSAFREVALKPLVNKLSLVSFEVRSSLVAWIFWLLGRTCCSHPSCGPGSDIDVHSHQRHGKMLSEL